MSSLYYAPNKYLSPSYPCSRHPGGINCGFVDGSVRFVKNSIDSWPSGNIPVKTDANGNYYLAPGSGIAVWQALGSRNGGEIVGGDAL